MEVYLRNTKSILIGLVCLTYIGLFFPIYLSNIPLIMLLVFCAIKIDLRQTITSFRKSAFFKLMIAIYLLQIVGLLYTINLHNGFFVLEKKICLLLIPLFLFPLLQENAFEPGSLFTKLGLITILSSVVLLIIGFYKLYFLNDSQAFYYGRDLSEGFTSIHYPYYSMYFACGSLMFFDSMFDRLMKKKYGFILLLTLFLYSLGIIVLVASKTGIVAFGIACIIFLYNKLPNKKISFAAIIIFLVSAGMFLYFNKTTQDRFIGLSEHLSVLKEDTLKQDLSATGVNMRLLFWKISVVHLWRDHSVITGVGTGDAQDYIDSLYHLPNYKLYGYIGWDSHNQWIFTLIQIGVAGVLAMALLYAKYFKEAFKKMDLKFIAFLLITFWFSFSESILESNKGIVFFSLFFTILAAPYSKE